MVKTTTQAAQAFNGANGAKANINVAAMVAFINANGGLGNVALQLAPNALTNGVMFGGGAMWRAMQPNKQGHIGHRGRILWACVNGLPTHTVNGITVPNYAGVMCKAPAKLGKPVLLSTIQAAHLPSGSSVFANANSAATNQNAVAAILNGGFNLSAQTANTYGTAFGKLVIAS